MISFDFSSELILSPPTFKGELKFIVLKQVVWHVVLFTVCLYQGSPTHCFDHIADIESFEIRVNVNIFKLEICQCNDRSYYLAMPYVKIGRLLLDCDFTDFFTFFVHLYSFWKGPKKLSIFFRNARTG